MWYTESSGWSIAINRPVFCSAASLLRPDGPPGFTDKDENEPFPFRAAAAASGRLAMPADRPPMEAQPAQDRPPFPPGGPGQHGQQVPQHMGAGSQQPKQPPGRQNDPLF